MTVREEEEGSRTQQETYLMPDCFSTDLLLGCNENPSVNLSETHDTVWGWSEQSLPPLLAPEASSTFSKKGILAVVYPNYRTTCPKSQGMTEEHVWQTR